MQIRIYSCGGTIDKVYFDANSEFQVGDPEIVGLLQEANIQLDYQVTSLMRKDSLDLTETDRELIRQRVDASPCQQILITHGTDTMRETALKLMEIEGKTIVLTGAIQPAALRHSDAAFNIGCAIMALQLLAPGVYIVINGRVFNPQACYKDVARQRFDDE